MIATAVVLATLLVAAPTAAPDLRSLLEQAETVARADPAAAADLARTVLAGAGAAADPALSARAHFLLGDHAYQSDRYGEALAELNRAVELLEGADAPFHLARCHRRRGDVYLYLRRYDRALEEFFAARRVFERVASDTPGREVDQHLAHLETQVGNVLHRSGDLAQALEAFERSRAAYEALGYAVGVTGSRLNTGNVLQEMGRVDEALDTFRAVAADAAAQGVTPLQIMGLTNAASALLALDRPAEALPLLDEARALCEPDNLRSLAHNHLKRADALLALDRPGPAGEVAEQARALATTLEDPLLERDAHEALARSAEAVGRADLALVHLRQVQRLDELLLDREKLETLAHLRVAYEAERHERELTLGAAREAALRTSRNALATGLALATALALAVVLGLGATLRRGATIRRQKVDLETAYHQVDELARTDPLTGLANRREMTERLAQEGIRARRSQRPFSLLLVDIDHFKRVNDEHGHACGDLVLVEVATRLKAALRGQDLVARWGGDEYLALLPETPLEGALAAARNVRAVLAAVPVPCREGDVRVTATIGVAQHAGDEDAESCLARADAALYRGKAAGRDRIVIEEPPES